MMKVLRKKRKGGFTLIELIVVIAILGILAAIAIPRFAGVRGLAQVKAEASTAVQVINALRVYEANNNLAGAATIANANTLMTVPVAFTITSGGGASPYVIGWTSTASGYATGQTQTEGVVFTPTATP